MKIFMIEGNRGWAIKNGSNPDLWQIEANLTVAQHEVLIARPSVTFESAGRAI